MSTKLGNALLLFKKWVGSPLTSGLLHNLTQVKVKEYASQSGLFKIFKILNENAIVKLILLVGQSL